MGENATSSRHRHARQIADAAAREEESLRERWESTQASLRERFDEPIERATVLTRRALAWFPVRVWRHFLQNNGFLLAAGVSYQTLFSFFAAIYVVFAVVGLWLGGSPQAVGALIALINSFIPGLIEDGGIISPEQVETIATQSAGVLGVTGVIAFGTVLWTAIGSVTFARRAVRDIFSIPRDKRPYIRLKSLDFLGALVFGLGLVVTGILNLFASGALTYLFELFGWNTDTPWFNLSLKISTGVVGFALNSAVLAGLFRFLTGTQLGWRRIWPGALLGGAALTVLQLGAGVLLTYTPTNLLLATFAVFIGLLLWFRLMGIVVLVAAAWIAVATRDRDLPLLRQSESERRAAEHRALLTAAGVRLRTAREARSSAPWYGVWAADRAVRAAEEELRRVEASAPPPVSVRADHTHARPALGSRSGSGG